MALSFDHGAVQWLAADAATSTYTVSGLSFQPKAIRFYWGGLGSSTDAVSETVDLRRGLGFATGTASRRCVGTISVDAAAAADTASTVRDDAIAALVTGAAANGGLLDLTAINSDGFTLTVDFQAVVDITIFWEAWGGSDITVATVGTIAEPAATGVQTYTVTGFTSGATDQVVMFAGCQLALAINNRSQTDSGFSVGFASGTASANNIVIVGNSDEGSLTMDTDSYGISGECLAMIAVAGGNPSARAQLTQWNTDNFGLNWIARATTDRLSIFMAIKGGNWSAGSYTIDGTTLNATATVSGLSFTPIGLCSISHRQIESTAGTSVAQDRMSLGTGTSTTSRRSMGMLDFDAVADADINLVIQYDQILSFPTSTGTLGGIFDINAMNSDGFQIIVDATGGSAQEWQGYLTFGSAAVSSNIYGLLLMGCGT